MQNQLDITLHQPIYLTSSLNITLSHDNLSQQLNYTSTQTIQSPQDSTPPAEDQALDLEQLLNSLPDDLYTDLRLGYEPSTEFQVIRDQFSEIKYSPASQKLFILSFHPKVYRVSFVLRNHTDPCLERHSVAIIIPRVISPMDTLETAMSVSDRWS